MVDIPVYESTAETLVTATAAGQEIFSFDFLVFTEDQTKVEYRPVTGAARELVLNTDYTVSGLNLPNGGSINLAGITVSVGDQLYIYRETPIEREKDWQNEGDYKADLVNREQDEIYMIMQELNRGFLSSTSSIAIEVAARIAGDQSLSDRIDGMEGVVTDAADRAEAAASSSEEAKGIAVDAADRAEAAAAGLNLPSIQPGDAGKSLIVNDDEDGYELGSSTAGEYESRATVEGTSIPETANFLRTAGYYVAGDGGGALYRRVGSEPAHAGKIQSLDGAWWSLSEQIPDMKMFGARGNGSANDSPAFQAAYNFTKLKGGGVVKVTATSSFYSLIETVTYDNTTNFHLMGVGKPLIQDMSTDGSNTFNIGNGTHSQFQTLLSDLKIWGPENPQNGNALNCSYAGSLRLERVNIFRHKLRGINADNCWTLSAVGCSVVGCSDGQVLLTGATGNGAIWTDCTFNDTPAGKFAFHIAGTDGVANPANGPHFGTTFIACRFEFNEFGLFAQYAHSLNLIGNYFEFNTTNAFRIVEGCDGVNIHGNSIFTSTGLCLGATNIDIRGNKAEWGGNIEVGDCTNVSWGPNGTTNKPNTIFGTTRNMEYEAFPGWVTYNSTWISSATQPSLGNGTLLFKYKRRGNTVQCSIELAIGSTSTFGSIGYGFRLPFNVAAGVQHLGVAGYLDASATATVHNLVAVCEPGANYVGLRNAAGSAVGPSSPITFAAGDKIYATFTYECAN